MNKLKDILKKLDYLFTQHGYKIYAVGGTVRDFLLNIELTDFDFATDAPPEIVTKIIPMCDNRFAKYGVITVIFENVKIEIATLRLESNYKDFRHPSKIVFVKDIKEDYKRRDFTINALYMDSNFFIHDFGNGITDLNTKTIRMIGDISQRMKEDPLRIIRALRFSFILGFQIEENLQNFIKNNINLLNNLNKEKIKQDIHKIKQSDLKAFAQFLSDFGVNIEL